MLLAKHYRSYFFEIQIFAEIYLISDDVASSHRELVWWHHGFMAVGWVREKEDKGESRVGIVWVGVCLLLPY